LGKTWQHRTPGFTRRYSDLTALRFKAYFKQQSNLSFQIITHEKSRIITIKKELQRTNITFAQY